MLALMWSSLTACQGCRLRRGGHVCATVHRAVRAMRAVLASGAATLSAVAAGAPVAAAPGVPAAGFRYVVPVQPSSPWPTMRRDLRNTASSPVLGIYRGDRPWAYRTGKGIFSTPVIGGDGTIYVGSGDSYFYALSSQGKLRWRFKTGNLIDSAGFIGAWDPSHRTYPVAVPSGDTYLYLIRSD